MLLTHALLAPHLPTLVIDRHRQHETPMLAALAAASERLLAEEPVAIVALSARWTTPGPFQVDVGRHHRTLTDYPGFGVEVRYDCSGHPSLARALVDAGTRDRVRVGPTNRGVDSGVAIPLFFLAPHRRIPVVPISVSTDGSDPREWGRVIRRVLAASPERIAFVVGGLLSFNPHEWGLNRPVPGSEDFDGRVLESLAAGDWSRAASFGGGEGRVRVEAGLRHLEVLRGFLGEDVKGELLCYEPSPGAGAALVSFPIPGASAGGAEATGAGGVTLDAADGSETETP